jgi:hypothetical protein
MAATKTVLNADHTVETLGEENVYGEVTTVVQNDTIKGVNQTTEDQKEQRREERIGNRDHSKRERLNQRISARLPDRQQQREFVTGAITKPFVRGELTRNIRTIYAVLNGEQSTGQMSVKLAQQQDKINQSIRESLRDDPEINQEKIVRLVAREVPDEQNLTENGTVPSEVTSASSSVGLVRTLNLGLPVLALVLLGGMFDFTGRDVRRTAKTGGVSLAIGGLLGAGIGLFLGGIASGAAESALNADSAEVAAMSDGIVAVVDSTFSTVITQGLIVAGVGILAVRVVFAEQRGYLDSVLGGDG